MKIQNVVSSLILAGLLYTSSCKQSSPIMTSTNSSVSATTNDYEAALQSGIKGSSYPGQFNRLFSDTMNGISYYTGIAGHPSWYSKVGLYDRYILTMILPIELDSTRTKIVSVGEPSFRLVTLDKITVLPDGRYYIEPDMSSEKTFSLHTWEQLLAAKGNFKSIGIVLDTNKPIEHFKEAWRKF